MSLSLGAANNGVVVFGETDFVTTWNTENLGGTGSATKVILLPMSAGVEVDWGDGTVNNLNTHTYSTGGVKTVKIAGAVTNFRFNDLGDKLKITDVSNVGGLVVDSSSMFRGCANMTWTATSAPSFTTAAPTQLFRGCTVFNGAIGDWDVSSISGSMASMFFDCAAFNQNLNSWDVSGATNMVGLFRDCAVFNQDLSGWDVSAVTDMTNMLLNSSFSQTNYDLLLVAWDAQTLQSGVPFHAGSATYGAGAPATARANLVGAPDLWTITDGGPA